MAQNSRIQILEKLPNLRVLYLVAMDLQGAEMVFCATGFLQLRELHLLYLTNLEVWKVEQGAMPLLSDLRILECSNLKMLPDQLRFLKNLKKLQILHMPREFQERVGRVNGVDGEDFDKIRHVPTRIVS